jgi:hypothetical protein
MPYLHWETSGDGLNYSNPITKEILMNNRDRLCEEPLDPDIAERDVSSDMEILRTFLNPTENDCCLHIGRTLDQYSTNILAEGAERQFEEQVVYKFAKRQHNKRMEQELDRKERERERERERETNRRERRSFETECSNYSNGKGKVSEIDRDSGTHDEERLEPSWNPPKVLMVNQLWVWVIDSGWSYLMPV